MARICSHASVEMTFNRVCFGDTTRFYNTSSIATSANVDWDLNNDGFFDDASGDSATKVFASADTFEVRLRVTDSSGVEYFSLPYYVIVDPHPVVNFLFRDTCLGSNTQLVNSSFIQDNSVLSYQWDYGNDGTFDASTTNGQVLFTDTGEQAVMLKVTSLQGCISQLVKTTFIRELPDAGFSFWTACAQEPTLMVNTTSWGNANPFQAIWYLGDDLVNFQLDSVLHTYRTSDTFEVKLRVTNLYGCYDTAVNQLIIPESVSYSYTFSNGQIFEQGGSTEVSITGQFASLQWGDNTTQNPRILSDSGYYVFTLSNSIGCQVSDSFLIQVTIPSDIQLKPANDFLTPNADGVNDYLFFKNLIFYNDCNLVVYNTHGFEVYSSANYQNDWDGYKNGKAVNPGTYYYFIKCNGEQELRGATNIIR